MTQSNRASDRRPLPSGFWLDLTNWFLFAVVLSLVQLWISMIIDLLTGYQLTKAFIGGGDLLIFTITLSVLAYGESSRLTDTKIGKMEKLLTIGFGSAILLVSTTIYTTGAIIEATNPTGIKPLLTIKDASLYMAIVALIYALILRLLPYKDAKTQGSETP